MSKKKNKKNKASYFGNTEKDSKGKKHDKEKIKSKLDTVKGSLSKKEIKAARKAVNKVKVPDEVKNAQRHCNHHKGGSAEVMSVADFKRDCPNGIAPMLELLIATFGENNVAVCKLCFTPIVKFDKISPNDLRRAIAIVKSIPAIVVSNKRMDRKEISTINKVIDDIVTELIDMSAIYNKTYEKIADQDRGCTTTSIGGSDTVRSTSGSAYSIASQNLNVEK